MMNLILKDYQYIRYIIIIKNYFCGSQCHEFNSTHSTDSFPWEIEGEQYLFKPKLPKQQNELKVAWGD